MKKVLLSVISCIVIISIFIVYQSKADDNFDNVYERFSQNQRNIIDKIREEGNFELFLDKWNEILANSPKEAIENYEKASILEKAKLEQYIFADAYRAYLKVTNKKVKSLYGKSSMVERLINSEKK